jgi:hypothetical protein
MSDPKDIKLVQMDKRCPRRLKTHPESFCPLAVMRLKAIRTASKELTEEEESKLPGCPWAVNHQMSNYCYFKYMNDYGDGKSLSDIEVAGLLNISVETVKKTEAKTLAKIKESEPFKELRDQEPTKN